MIVKLIDISCLFADFRMPEDTTLEGAYVFRGVEYVITMKIHDGSMLTVVVEDRLTANQWKGSFDSNCNSTFLHHAKYFLL